MFHAEHTEDFYADPTTPGNWRTKGRVKGTLGNLASRMFNAARVQAGSAHGRTMELLDKLRMSIAL